ncbi:MAG: BrnA antitoxin family protein [Caulobacteraceae bacterium]
MTRKLASGETPWTDPDDAPPLTSAFFERADLYEGERLVRRGRPPLPSPKRQVTLRLDADLVERLRASGYGWQTRVNEALGSWLASEAS